MPRTRTPTRPASGSRRPTRRSNIPLRFESIRPTRISWPGQQSESQEEFDHGRLILPFGGVVLGGRAPERVISLVGSHPICRLDRRSDSTRSHRRARDTHGQFRTARSCVARPRNCLVTAAIDSRSSMRLAKPPSTGWLRTFSAARLGSRVTHV
jgi:hypothetical protein